jgi:hypothetical protein
MAEHTFKIKNYKNPGLIRRILKEVMEQGEDESYKEFEKRKGELSSKFSDYGDYIDLEIKVNKDLEIIGGRILEQ